MCKGYLDISGMYFKHLCCVCVSMSRDLNENLDFKNSAFGEFRKKVASILNVSFCDNLSYDKC